MSIKQEYVLLDDGDGKELFRSSNLREVFDFKRKNKVVMVPGRDYSLESARKNLKGFKELEKEKNDREQRRTEMLAKRGRARKTGRVRPTGN